MFLMCLWPLHGILPYKKGQCKHIRYNRKKDFKGRNTAVSHSLLLLRKRGFGSVKPGGARWVLQGPMPTLMGDAARGNSESPN